MQYYNGLLLAIILLAFYACNQEKAPETIALIPQPQSLEVSNGGFELNNKTVLVVEDQAVFGNELQQYLNEIKACAKLELKSFDNASELPKANAIFIKLDNTLEYEAYGLNITDENIIVTAASGAGAFYALQTLKQLMPINPDDGAIALPTLTITDRPVFGWRGYMLDVSRHFFEIEKLYEVVDFMADLKLNRFHIHLADDQGWRLEIENYSTLTEIGAWRVDYNITDEKLSNWWGRPVQKKGEKATYGGFYTKEQMRELIAYAKSKHIEIVPEIDVPGHSQEILASYPELACDHSSDYYVATGGVNKDNVLCASNPKTYEFLETVIGEVAELFPFEYIHIGGDECNKNSWKNHQDCQNLIKKEGLKDEHELQSYFIKRVERIVNQYNKHLIGWDEILEGGLAPNATVMSWRGEKGGIAAAKQGHNVIMAPNYANYLDLKQGQSDHEPNFGYSEALLSTCYNYKVIPDELSAEEAKHIMGTECNLWTESISDWGKATYMTFPRIFAMAENAWTDEKLQNFGNFIERLKPNLHRLDSKNVRYAKSVFNPWIHQQGNGQTIEVVLDSELPNAEIRYTIDGSAPLSNSAVYKEPLIFNETGLIKAGIFEDGQLLGNIIEQKIIVHKAKGAEVIYYGVLPNSSNANGAMALTDLNYGQLIVKDDKNWQTFTDDLDVEIIFEKPTDIESITVNSMRFTHKGIYPVQELIVLGSVDGTNFSEMARTGIIKENLVKGRNRISNKINCRVKKLMKIQVQAKILKQLPDSSVNSNRIQMQIDEIIVE